MHVAEKHRCPAGNYMFKVNNRNTRTRCQIYSKFTIKTPERCQWHRSGVFIVNFEHISHLALVFLLLTLTISLQAGLVFPSFWKVAKLFRGHISRIAKKLAKHIVLGRCELLSALNLLIKQQPEKCLKNKLSQ